MKKTKSILSAIVLASAALASQSASAGVMQSTSTVELVSNTAEFGNLFKGGNAGQLFSDTYKFTTTAMANLSADLFVKNVNDKNGLGISGFSLFNASGELVGTSAMAQGAADLWSLNIDNLAAGEYFIQVSGNLLSNAAGKYSANLSLGSVAEISEPATYGMMLAGLGMLAITARRRKLNVAPSN